VGVSVYVIWVTSQGPCGENAHQCEMFAILSYVVKLVIKSRILNPVTRQPASPWQPFRAALVGGGVVPMLAAEYEVDVTTHDGVIAHLSVYIRCPCYLDL